MKKVLLFGMLTIYIFVNSMAQKYSNEFLTIGVGARSFAMGQASVASTSDVTSGYWNPAGLEGMESKFDISLMHSEYYAGIAKYDYAAFAYKLDSKSALSVSFIRYAIDNIPNTLELFDAEGNMRYDRIKTFSAADYAFLFSYAKQTSVEGLSLGGSAKVIRRVTGSFANAWGFGLDAGARFARNNWRFAAVVRDATSTFNAWMFETSELKQVFELTGNEIPSNSVEVTLPRLITGVSRQFSINEKFGALAEADVEFTFDGKRNALVGSKFTNIDPRIGLEFNYLKMVYVRSGINNIQNVPNFEGKKELQIQPNIGIGLAFYNVNVDYAFSNVGEAVGRNSHVFSLRYRFGNE